MSIATRLLIIKGQPIQKFMDMQSGGPFRIIEKTGRYIFRLQLHPGMKLQFLVSAPPLHTMTFVSESGLAETVAK